MQVALPFVLYPASTIPGAARFEFWQRKVASARVYIGLSAMTPTVTERGVISAFHVSVSWWRLDKYQSPGAKMERRVSNVATIFH